METTENTLPQNKMGTAPINKLMLVMGLPMVLSMVLQAFYNIVDSYFVSNMADTAAISGMGEYGVNALTLAFPVQILSRQSGSLHSAICSREPILLFKGFFRHLETGYVPLLFHLSV